MIEKVEGLSAKLEIVRFGYRKELGKGRVHIELPLSEPPLVGGLKLHPSIDRSEMLLQPLFLSLLQL